MQTRPDLILLPEYHAVSPAVVEQFAAVAPTVVMAGVNTADWREQMRFYAEVLGREAELETLLRRYEEHFSEFLELAGGRFEGVSASQVQAVDTSAVYLSFPNYRGWGPLQDAGFRASAAQREVMDRAGAGSVDLLLSNERLDLLGTDYLFFIGSGADAEREALRLEVAASPLWAALPAVQNDRLYFVDLAWQANGLLSAEAVTDDLFRLLLEQDPPTPNPFRPE